MMVQSSTHSDFPVKALLESLVVHVALPPRLPDKQEGGLEQIQYALTERLLRASTVLRDLTYDRHGADLDTVCRSIQTTKIVNAGGKLSQSSLVTSLRGLQGKDILIVHVAEQNAALLIRNLQGSGESVIFEAFETSAVSEDVLAAKGALEWDFPGSAVSVPSSIFQTASFQNELAIFLSQASKESIKRFAARTNKAGSFAFESRDSVDPGLITSMLMTILEVNGSRSFPIILKKQVRDDVCWAEGENPWRRSGYWLALRVGVQRQLCELFGGEIGMIQYKFLMCQVIADILEESLEVLSPELLSILKTKLCRRMAKLEVSRQRAGANIQNMYDYMFSKCSPHFAKITSTTSDLIGTQWANFKTSIQRPSLQLPRYADQRHLYLTLPNSGQHIQQILSEASFARTRIQEANGCNMASAFDLTSVVTQQARLAAVQYFSLAAFEADVENVCAPSDDGSQERCIQLAKIIETYLQSVSRAYDSNPEQKSIMLLSVMELWAAMDRNAITSFPLLSSYRPSFPTNILDVLLLPSLHDMSRLQLIRSYLEKRHRACKDNSMTIFNDPVKGCFAECFFDDACSPESEELDALCCSIRTGAEKAYKAKENDWRRKCSEFEELNRQISESTCLYITDEYQGKTHMAAGCKKCTLERTANRFRMRAHEDPLPANDTQVKAVVFELACPTAFAAYREATWKIISTLGFPTKLDAYEPRLTLPKYSELSKYMKPSKYQFCLASTTKSFLQTHYANPRFPVGIKDVCLPNGLKLGYFDPVHKIWPGRITQIPSFSHHCRLTLPEKSPLYELVSSLEFSTDSKGLSSYAIIASQTKCPAGVNVHEYLAFQNLFFGTARRWLQILLELGSSNLNFSADATVLLVCHLALKAGPAHDSDPLGVVHSIFREESFCQRLLSQLRHRVEMISSNWREVTSMELLITLALRLVSLGEAVRDDAIELLERIRVITFQWISVLRNEIPAARNSESSRTFSRHALHASVLCRRTFAIYLENERYLDAEAINLYIGSSVTMQENLVPDSAPLPVLLRFSLIRDLKMVHALRWRFWQSLQDNPHCLASSIDLIWPNHEGAPSKSLSGVRFLVEPEPWWVEATIDATQHTTQQTIHYHILEGHLLISGQPVGKLPAEYRQSVVLEQLFGNQSLLTYPSDMEGMTHKLAIQMHGHQVYLGFRHGSMIVRARLRDTVLELIPREKFHSSGSFDLPTTLVQDCTHWLDINTGKIEIRQLPNIWKSKPGNWVIDFGSRQAFRRNVTLLDPQSPLFQRVARNFNYFEYPQHLTVFQPQKGPLVVELRRLELSFFVNKRNRLESRQLRAEIDPDQDVGAWYGLMSKIVLREVTPNRESMPQRKRTVLVPLGPLKHKRNGIHVEIHVENIGDYGCYTINVNLGRLDCPVEPRLLYLKAQYHAFTSYIIPDPLTGRTGTEEAIHCLLSGYSQPWCPLTTGPALCLVSLARLTPRRDYYPAGMKVMQRVNWDIGLPTIAQHDSFRVIVEGIFAKSRRLSVFTAQKPDLPPLEPGGDSHLILRSRLRRQAYQRPNSDKDAVQDVPSIRYLSRAMWRDSQGRSNVYECTALLRNWPSKMPTVSNLSGVLQSWPTIVGYNGLFDKILLSDLLNVQFSLDWGSLVNLCRASARSDTYQLMFLFGTMSFRQDINMDIVRTLIAFSVFNDLKVLELPKWPAYSHFRSNQVPNRNYIKQLIKPCLIPYGEDERSTLGFALSSKQRKKLGLAEMKYEKQQEQDLEALAEYFLSQWPCVEPTVEGFSRPVFIDIEQALKIIRPEFSRLFHNLELSEHITQAQKCLDLHRSEEQIEPLKSEAHEQDVLPMRCRGGEIPTLIHLLRKVGPLSHIQTQGLLKPRILVKAEPLADEVKGRSPEPRHTASNEPTELRSILKDVSNSTSTVRQQYGHDLMGSLDALIKTKKVSKVHQPINDLCISTQIFEARQFMLQQFHNVCAAFDFQDPCASWLRQGGLWPALTPVTLLENLRSTVSHDKFGDGMKESLVQYALAITRLQRLLRIEEANQKGNKQQLNEEQQNEGHSNWKPMERTDWLLLEIDSNLLIRPGQVEVALATINPESGSSSVLQMNMGLGKTSCVMPIVAAELANGSNLLRVIVPKALLLQSAQLMHAKLGGLLGREVRHVPYSRKTTTTLATIRGFYEIHRDIQHNSGIMMALAENILSFKLSGLQRLSDGLIPEASEMIRVQKWLEHNARDILDEVDYVLGIRTQLIYPSGSQKTVDGGSNRWETIELLLKQVDLHLWNLQKEFPHSIEVVRRDQCGYPFMFFLRKDVEDELIARIVEDVYHCRTSILPEGCTKADLLAIKKYISEPKVPQHVVQHIRRIRPDKPSVRQVVHLVRGLLVHRILLMTLKKRWNVQYGLSPSRDPMAVPFHAKGTPSEQAEWGHPDVAILFTCLAFYYDGLSLSQLRQSLQNIVRADDPSQIYDSLSYNSQLPDSLKDWNSINVDDEAQLHEIWLHLRYQVVVIDYFLNNFVFPKHAKQFELKLQASGWDIPLSSPQPSRGQNLSQNDRPGRYPLTTGFSGTNEVKLPLTIKQCDLPGLAHTNAEVLTYLLQARNRRYEKASDQFGRRLSEIQLLRKISSMGIRILIDAGAQILELDNVSLAKAWLEVNPAAPAIVYFNKDNKPFVRYQKGHEVPLLASPYCEDLGDCLVFLDEAHSRGTDLKMPQTACGALTLGLGQTKDHTVQAAMRLRQLGTSQSIVFFAPPEVHQSIIDLRGKKSGDKIDSADVVYWLLEQTCSGIELFQPLFFSQGLDFCRRTQAAIDNADFLSDVSQREAYLGSLRQFEQQTLKQLYGVSAKPKTATVTDKFSPELAVFMTELKRQRKNFHDSGTAVHGSALKEVEQEREVAFEIENVREVQKVTHYPPFSFPGLHRDITTFVRTGRLVADSTAYEHALAAIRRTSLGLKYGINLQGSTCKLYVSAEFTKTVKLPPNRSYDHFQRNVNWIIWSSIAETALIIIPEEAETILHLMSVVKESPTHLLIFSPPVTRKMLLDFSDLMYYSVPTLPANWVAPMSLKVELGIFAGRLYFNFDEYQYLCNYLGVNEKTNSLEDDENGSDECLNNGGSDGRELAISTKADGIQLFTRKPLTFLQEWLALRRKGQDFSLTPIGHICQGKPLKADHSFFMKVETNRQRESLPSKAAGDFQVPEDEADDADMEFYDAEEMNGGDAGDFEDTFDDNALLAE